LRKSPSGGRARRPGPRNDAEQIVRGAEAERKRLKDVKILQANSLQAQPREKRPFGTNTPWGKKRFLNRERKGCLIGGKSKKDSETIQGRKMLNSRTERSPLERSSHVPESRNKKEMNGGERPAGQRDESNQS